MKIAMIVSTFYPKIGGMGRMVLVEAEGLTDMGHEVTVFTMAYPGQPVNEDLGKIKIRRIKPYFRLGDGGFMPDFSSELNKFDIVHLHYPFYGGAHIVLRVNTRIFLTAHMEASPSGVVKKIFKFFYDSLYNDRIWKKADKIILVDGDYFQNFYLNNKASQGKIVQLSNCVDTEKFFYSPKSRVSGKKHLLFVGNLLPIKGLSVLFKLLKKYPEKYILTVVGGGYAEAEYKDMARIQGIAPAVMFVGAITDAKQMINFYHQADVLVVSSYKESFSLVATEAMSAGCPVVVSDIPGLRERVIEGQDGFLFSPGDADELDKALNNLFSLNEEQKKSLLFLARQKVEQNYSSKKHLTDLTKIYER